MWIQSLAIPEQRGIVAAIAALILGLILASVVKFANIGDSATLIALLLIPFLAYGAASGKLRELTGPGGWGAKFQEAAAEKIKPTPVTACVQNLQVVPKGGINALQEVGQHLQKGKPIALTLQLGAPDYVSDALKRYIETLRIADPEAIVLFLDQGSGLVAYAEATTVLGLLPEGTEPDEFMKAIRSADVPYLRSLPGFCWQSLTLQRSNAEALQLMRELNARTVVVVDENKRPIGVVKRDHIIAQLLVELAGVSRPTAT